MKRFIIIIISLLLLFSTFFMIRVYTKNHSIRIERNELSLRIPVPKGVWKYKPSGSMFHKYYILLSSKAIVNFYEKEMEYAEENYEFCDMVFKKNNESYKSFYDKKNNVYLLIPLEYEIGDKKGIINYLKLTFALDYNETEIKEFINGCPNKK